MAGLIAALFGGRQRPDTNPHPGIGGYDMPRGPYGEGGFPGSTSAAPPVHPQSEEGTRQRQLTASGAQNEWKRLPARRTNGTPRQPHARNPRQSTDTEKYDRPVISANVPGNQNQRNTKYQGGRKAAPGLPQTRLSAHLSGGRKPEEVTVSSDRYVFDGVNGGFESYSMERRMPYTGFHGEYPAGYEGDAHVRGADLSGQRFTQPAKANLNQGGQGSFGIARARGPQHKPVRFVQPGPWSANYRIEAPDEGTQAPNMVHRSPSPKSKTGRTKPKPHNPAKPETSHNTERRTLPTSRGRVTNGRRR